MPVDITQEQGGRRARTNGVWPLPLGVLYGGDGGVTQ